MTWEIAASALADQVTHRSSHWRAPVAVTPRHLFVPQWWEADNGQWTLREPVNDEQWFSAAYADRSLITRVGPLHADQAKADEHPTGRPTSSATLPSLIVRMFQHAHLDDGDTLLDVGTGSGYGAALAAHRLGSAAVTSVDIDAYLVQAARERLNLIGLHPNVETADATGPLPALEGQFDRIVATVAVRNVPASWLTALSPGGRLVTTLAGTSLIVTADKTEDGGAVGRVEWDRAGFMHARHHTDYPAGPSALLAAAHDQDSEDVTIGPYPVVDVANAWDLDSMLGITAPGIEHAYHEKDGRRTAVMVHADGSWARATAIGSERPTVHQSGPRRLWDILDAIRSYWLQHGELPARGAHVHITPNGHTHLTRGHWHADL
ncbi:methyltransferase domain-containing protein [Streptomyces justiciae]|uniref:methyltransferase domain-containing protein n=1 Tax=Streptomyces justiciae TaxID=2780140 RepID=UPI0021190AEF|nr:methyltransferase domain-containing protein [Streptomyces justiciae]MCW8382441.1 methyltransferase domain-containing protein [Streptomyces justiciae]